MKDTDKQKRTGLVSSENLETLRKELHQRIMREDLQYVLHMEAVDRLMTDLKVDPENFRQLWVQPLLAAGATLDVALVCIAQSYLRPN